MFFEALNTLVKPRKREIIEKDCQLHKILHGISEDDYISSNLVFKGGTCLIKAYTGYYRFSEDIDFTWRHADLWKNRSSSKTKKLYSQMITTLIDRFKTLSNKQGFSFEGDKTDPKQIRISSGGRMVVFFFGYNSDILNRQEKIKIEINFVDKILYPFQNRTLKSYVDGVASEELKFVYKESWKDYTIKIKQDCYDPREIFIEKCRAAITRKAYKLRDIIDIYYLEKNCGYNINDYREQITDKIQFIQKLYRRYKENIEAMEFPKSNLLHNEEMGLMIVQPPKDLPENIKRIHRELDIIRRELME